ncbi:MAG: LptA/OstA family protein, partial [Pirellulales bacterium]|nr:LptA/OstA family protein [Pirellulales bacterium]
VWFEEPARPAAAPGLPAAGPPGGTAAGKPGTPLADQLEADPAEPLQRRFRVRGQLVQSRVLIRERRGELSELMLEGDVELDEIPLRQASEQPIRVRGDRIQAIDAESPNTNISVIGRPAQFSGRGLTLTGTNINVNAGTNRLWIDGSGQMELPLDRDLKGEPLAQPGTIQVNWQQRMDFDGQTALFEEAVTANTASEVLRTETLEVRFTRPIQFRQAGSQPAPDLDRLTCRGGVLFEGRGFQQAAQVAWQQFEAEQLWIDRTRGEIHAQGPGRVTSIRPRVAELPLRRGAEPHRALPPSADAAKLACLDVRFQDALRGDIGNRKIVFHDQVQCVYGDLASWQSRLDIHDPDSLGEAGVKLSADQLAVAEAIAPLTGRQSVELEAQGNVIAENRTYTARASRMTYSESKDLLILEGNGHVPAELAHQKFIGGPVLTSAARQIYFWPSTKSVKVADGRSLEMNGIDRP